MQTPTVAVHWEGHKVHGEIILKNLFFTINLGNRGINCCSGLNFMQNPNDLFYRNNRKSDITGIRLLNN